MSGQSRVERANHLRLIEPSTSPDLPPVLTSGEARRQFMELTQALVDAAIEIADLCDGDPDPEPNGDEFEDSDG